MTLKVNERDIVQLGDLRGFVASADEADIIVAWDGMDGYETYIPAEFAERMGLTVVVEASLPVGTTVRNSFQLWEKREDAWWSRLPLDVGDDYVRKAVQHEGWRFV